MGSPGTWQILQPTDFEIADGAIADRSGEFVPDAGIAQSQMEIEKFKQ
jgi:hypothetical protein